MHFTFCIRNTVFFGTWKSQSSVYPIPPYPRKFSLNSKRLSRFSSGSKFFFNRCDNLSSSSPLLKQLTVSSKRCVRASKNDTNSDRDAHPSADADEASTRNPNSENQTLRTQTVADKIGSAVTASMTTAVVAQDPISATVGVEKEVFEEEVEAAGRQKRFVYTPGKISSDLANICAMFQTWNWEGHAINYVTVGQGPPVVLIHGFGASIGHFRKNINVLAEKHTVFAIDLLGLGASDKPLNYEYSIENWARLVLDFLREVVKNPAVLIGNSIGSLVVLLATSECSEEMVRGSVLLNCAGGLNNKAIADDWRIFLLLPLFSLIDALLLRPSIASFLFNRFRTPENVRTILKSVYCNKDAVDDELVEIIVKPSNASGALEAFVGVITGPPGPRPETLVPRISQPILLLWGDKDTFTPMDGPVGKYFLSLPQKYPNVNFITLPEVGHCPHDDDPDAVHAVLLPWLDDVYHAPKP